MQLRLQGREAARAAGAALTVGAGREADNPSAIEDEFREKAESESETARPR